MSLTIQELVEKSRSRGVRWHGNGQPWTATDWAAAMEGEGGELVDAVLDLCLLVLTIKGHSGQALNALKKLRRIETDVPNINSEPGRQLDSITVAKTKIAQEVADFILYVPQFCDSLGIDLEQALCVTFNNKSIEYGFPERLGMANAEE